MPSAARLSPQSELSPVTVDWDLAFLQAPTRQGLAYWQSLRNGHQFPSRRALSPRAMRNFLGHVNLVDVVPGAGSSFDYIISLQGEHAREVFGRLAGRKLREILSPALEQRWRKSFDLPRTATAPVRLFTRAGTAGKNWLACEALLAPLGEDSRVQTLFWVLASWKAK
jgi:hypothetical protein